MKNIDCLAIKNEDGALVSLYNLGYEWYDTSFDDNICKYDEWIFIRLRGNRYGNHYGKLVDGDIETNDYVIDINEIPLLKDLDNFVKVLVEGNKMGLL